jgi:hypothetical protein
MNEDKESRASMSRLPTLELRHHAVVAGEHTQVIGRGPDLHVLSGDDWCRLGLEDIPHATP